MSETVKKKLHYAWFILGVCVLINIIVHAPVMSVSNLYIVPMYNDLKVPRTLLSLQSIAMVITSVISAPIWGKLYKTKGARKILPLCIAGTALCTIGRSFMPNIWAILCLAFVKGFFFTGSTLLPISILLTIWFTKSRGLAISIASIGSSVGGVIFSPLTESWISNYGWRVSDRIVGGIMLVICVPLVYLIVRSFPKDIGLRPYGVAENTNKEATKEKKQEEVYGMTVSEAKKSPQLYLLLTSIFFMTIATGAALQMPTYLADIGYGTAIAAKAVSGYMAIGIVGKILIGTICDKKGVKFGTIYSCGVGILAFVCFIIAGSRIGFLGMIVFYGLACGITAVMPALLTSRIFGTKDYGPIYGWVVSINRFGGGIGTLLVSLLFDITGNYSIIWPVCTAAMIFCLIALVSAISMSDKKMKAEK